MVKIFYIRRYKENRRKEGAKKKRKKLGEEGRKEGKGKLMSEFNI